MEEVIGDGAYSGQANLENAEREEVSIIAKLNSVIANGNVRSHKGFTYNKDAGMMVCPAGHMATRKNIKDRSKEKKNKQIRFSFDVHKCRVCKHAEECGYKGTKEMRYNITILSEQQEDLKRRQDTDEFKEKYKERYIVEAKNSNSSIPTTWTEPSVTDWMHSRCRAPWQSSRPIWCE